jgi:hypothetical protein
MNVASDGCEMMFAGRDKRDRSQGNHIIIAVRRECPREDFRRVKHIPSEPFIPGTHDACGRIAQAFAIRIVTGRGDQSSDSAFDILVARLTGR